MTTRTRLTVVLWCALMALGVPACSAPADEGPAAVAPGDEESPADAQAALVAYFAALNEGRFDDAAELYAGNYEALQTVNPDVDADDHARLLERWCTQNGGVCLPIQDVLEGEINADGGIQFVVTLAHADGSTFGIGPCCGEPDSGQRITQFVFLVREIEAAYRVLSLPPYVP
jgi:hypothetical protein